MSNSHAQCLQFRRKWKTDVTSLHFTVSYGSAHFSASAVYYVTKPRNGVKQPQNFSNKTIIYAIYAPTVVKCCKYIFHFLWNCILSRKELKVIAPSVHTQLGAMLQSGEYTLQHVLRNGRSLLASVFFEVFDSARLVREPSSYLRLKNSYKIE